MTKSGAEFEPVADAFADAIAASRPLLLGSAIGMIQHREMAEDAVQDAMVKGLERHKQFRGDSAISTWLVSILRNQVIDTHRLNQTKQKHEVTDDGVLEVLEDLELPGPSDNPELRFMEKESAKSVLKELEKLPPRQRAAVLLRIIGFGHHQVASLLGVTFTTAKTNAKRGLDKI